MIDRRSRDKLAETLRQYTSGRITNYKLDDVEFSDKDYGAQAVKQAAWFLYDDLYTHKAIGKHYINKENKHEISKWILFLQSDKEYLWPMPSISQILIKILTFGFYGKRFTCNGDEEAWPFYKNIDLENAILEPKLLSGI